MTRPSGHQEFCEIPFDLASSLRMRSLVRQELIERRRVLALYGHFGHHGKSYVVLSTAERLDLLVCAGLLAAKIIPRECPRLRSHGPCTFHKMGFQRRVLRCVTAPAGDIGRAARPSPWYGAAERRGLSINGIQSEVVQPSSLSHRGDRTNYAGIASDFSRFLHSYVLPCSVPIGNLLCTHDWPTQRYLLACWIIPRQQRLADSSHLDSNRPPRETAH